jgi:hypothetical protein
MYKYLKIDENQGKNVFPSILHVSHTKKNWAIAAVN